MKIEWLKPKTQEWVRKIAAEKGITVEEVLKHFDAIFSDGGVSRHRRLFS